MNEASMQTTVLRVHKMDCPNEITLIEKSLGKLEAVNSIDANLLTGKATIIHSESITPEDLISALRNVGLESSIDDGVEKKPLDGQQNLEKRLVTASGAALFLGLTLKWGDIEPILYAQIFFAISILFGGALIIPGAITAARRLLPDINLLMTIAVFGAILIGEWAEGAVVFFLFSLSELLEAMSVSRTRRAVRSLLDLSPPIALVKRGEEFREAPVEEVIRGSIVLVKAGARLPLDGKVVRGRSAVNEAPITGESMPVEKNPGDMVFAGTMNGTGSFEFEVTQKSNDTTLARIVHLIEEAQDQKAETQRFVDRFSQVYTPAVIVLSILIFLVPPLLFSGDWSTSLYRALVLLVISCPCALVISTPVSVVSGLTALAKNGVLVKGGLFLESLAKLRALAVDKTGTLTEGKPEVGAVYKFGKYSENDILRLTASLDAQSNHPLAEAITACARNKKIPLTECSEFKSITGHGVEGELEGHYYFAGNHRMTHDLGVCTPEVEEILDRIESQGQSVVVLGHKPHADCKGEILGVIAVGDRLRMESRTAIENLTTAGIDEIVLLSGDNQRTVKTIASLVGIKDVRANLLPEDKVAAVKELVSEYKYVGMVGDGVNDAPAMAAASIGIAMGVAGTDTAIETADVALMKDDLRKISEAILLSRRTQRIIRFNIAFAIEIKAVFILLTLFGYASLWLAIAADTGVTLLVIANALRILKKDNN